MIGRGMLGRLAGAAAGLMLLAAPGVVRAQSAGVIPAATPAAASSLVVKAAPGVLYDFDVVSGASAGFVLVLDAASVPADGAVTPVKCYALAANTTLAAAFTLTPAYFRNGIVIVFSTTGCFTKTASATAYISADGS